jgi:putative PIN family toxin of toxin-antitoxin system
MFKIVIDSNVFFSALYSNRGASFEILLTLADAKADGKYINCVSVPTILELEDILVRPKNRELLGFVSEQDLGLFINDIVLMSERVRLNYLWRPYLRDSGDDKILEVAFNGGAKYIVTHNIKDFIGVDDLFNIKVITPKQFLHISKEI